MYRDDAELVSGLAAATGLEVLYENYDQRYSIPCVTYRLSSGTERAGGDSVWYDYLIYTVKVWAESALECSAIGESVDEYMRGRGYTLESCEPLVYNGSHCLMAKYGHLSTTKGA